MKELFKKYIENNPTFDGLFDYNEFTKLCSKPEYFIKLENYYYRNNEEAKTLLEEFKIDVKSNFKKNLDEFNKIKFKEKEPTIKSFEYMGTVHEY